VRCARRGHARYFGERRGAASLELWLPRIDRPADRAAQLQSQIKSYDAADAAAVSAWIRTNGSMVQAVNQIEEIYVETLSEHRAMPPVPDGELIADDDDYLLVLARKIKELMSQERPNAALK
jgi:hypothetical protein